MVTRRGEATLRIGADIRGVLAGLSRIEDRARQTQRRLNNVTAGGAGAIGRGARGIGRGGLGAGSLIGAGFGVGAGLAFIEQIVERVIELFEDTPVFEEFTKALTSLFEAVGPLIGVLLSALTPILLALVPIIEALVPAFEPLLHILGQAILEAVLALTPALLELIPALQPLIEIFGAALAGALFILEPILGLVAKGFGFLTDALLFLYGKAKTIISALTFGAINLPNIGERSGAISTDEAARQLAEAQAKRLAEMIESRTGAASERSSCLLYTSPSPRDS